MRGIEPCYEYDHDLLYIIAIQNWAITHIFIGTLIKFVYILFLSKHKILVGSYTN